MYALPVAQEQPNACPLGYDSVREIDGVIYCWPNDEAFKVLVQAKYLMAQSATRKVSLWLGRELIKMKYNFSLTKNYNEKAGLSHTVLATIMKQRRPFDECLLPLDERERIFRIETARSLPSYGDDGRYTEPQADTETTNSD